MFVVVGRQDLIVSPLSKLSPIHSLSSSINGCSFQQTYIILQWLQPQNNSMQILSWLFGVGWLFVNLCTFFECEYWEDGIEQQRSLDK